MQSLKITTLLFWLSALFFSNQADSQTPLKEYEKLTAKFNEEQLILKVDSLLTACHAVGDFVSEAEIAHKHAIYYVRPSAHMDFKKASNYGAREYSLFQYGLIKKSDFRNVVSPEVFEKDYLVDSMHTRAATNLGRFYSRLGMYEEATAIFEGTIERNVSPLRVAQAYAELGKQRNKQGDFFNAVNLLTKSIDRLEELGEVEEVAIQSLNLAAAHRNVGTSESFAKGQKALEKAESLQENLGKRNRSSLMNDLGNQYISDDMFDFNKAYQYYQKGLDIGLSAKDSSMIGMVLNNLANLYNFKKSDSTIYYFNEAFKFVKDRSIRARLFDTRSDYHLYRGNLKQALNDIHLALEINLDKTFSIEQVPDLLDLSKSELMDYTILCLRKKTEILIAFFDQTNESKYLNQAIAHVKAADELIDLIQSGSYESETKLLWRRAASEVYIKGVYAAHLLEKPEEMFYFIEKNRALLLSEEIATNTAFTKLPIAISEKTQSLKKVVLRLENQNSDGSSKLIRDSLFNAKKQFEYFLDSVNEAYPAYFERKLAVSTVSLSEWQQQLKPDTTFISYAWNQLNEDTEILMGMAVGHEKTESFAITDTDSLKSLIAQYQQLFSHPFRTKNDQERSRLLSNTLFNILLPTPDIRAMAQNKKLLIVPDGPLQYIPFEALVTDLEANTFLISETDVSYLYSVSFLKYNDQLKRSAPNRFTGYAPVKFKKKTGLLPLQQTRTELNAIENEIGGKIVFDRKASKSYFLNHSDDYRMIHLATHADASGTPWIAFSDEKLELHELYTYKNNAELVTLSACNTLQGEVASGEGVLSLSRGFFYSGAKSVMASLWNVDDKATSGIMASFYANLNTGQTKSEALANAKRDYLKTHSLSEQSPYYWSSIILMGDSSTVDMSVSYFHLYLIGSLLFILLLLIFLRKKLSN